MTIREKINEIIDRYYDDEEDRYSTCREDELEEFLTSNNIEHKVEKEDGFENAGIDTYFIAVAFIDENNKLDLITVYLEDR